MPGRKQPQTKQQEKENTKKKEKKKTTGRNRCPERSIQNPINPSKKDYTV